MRLCPGYGRGVLFMIPRDGATYDHARDGRRLTCQHNRVLCFMRDGQWHTLDAIAGATGDPPASVSARIRDLRKERFGAYLVERRYIARGLWEYRLVVGQLDLLDKVPHSDNLRVSE